MKGIFVPNHDFNSLSGCLCVNLLTAQFEEPLKLRQEKKEREREKRAEEAKIAKYEQ
jgi:hypothetical protein